MKQQHDTSQATAAIKHFIAEVPWLQDYFIEMVGEVVRGRNGEIGQYSVEDEVGGGAAEMVRVCLRCTETDGPDEPFDAELDLCAALGGSDTSEVNWTAIGAWLIELAHQRRRQEFSH